jgi:hypothetical protein
LEVTCLKVSTVNTKTFEVKEVANTNQSVILTATDDGTTWWAQTAGGIGAAHGVMPDGSKQFTYDIKLSFPSPRFLLLSYHPEGGGTVEVFAMDVS